MTPYEHMWQEVRDYYKGKRCLVTGANGFIGGTICNKLREMESIIIKMDISHGSDVTHYDYTMDGFDWHKPEIVFHLAAETEVGRSYISPHSAYHTNIVGTLNLLEICRNVRYVKSIVIASTDKVYGLAPVPYKEEMDLDRCTNPYAASKQYADRIAQDYARFYDLPIRIIRCCNVYGPGQLNATTLITSAVLNLLSNRKAKISKGNHEREWLYIDDCVLAYLLLGMLRDTDLRIYNVGSGECLRPVDIVSKIISMLCMGDYEWVPDNSHIADFNQRVDSSSFRYDFPHWKTIGIGEGLSKTVEWYKAWVNKEKGVPT